MASTTAAYAKLPRVFILSDISNEPDDAESLVRYLLYSNNFQTEGLVATTSTWLKHKTHPEDMEKIVRAYGKVVCNLNAHVHPDAQFRPASDYLKLICSGPKMYGKEALQSDVELSEGSKRLIDALDASEDALWVLLWGGANCLAQALQSISARSVEDQASARSKIRVYSISDQDDTSAWIRLSWPEVFWIGSTHAWNAYGLATWVGISGDKYYNFEGGPDFTTVSKEWIKEHIQVGPLGEAYPDYMFIPEGDTPTFLFLMQNGLNFPEHPEYGGWGGRYLLTDIGGSSKHYTDAVDRVIGIDGKLYSNNHCTIWRWRGAFQSDFAARMQWTLTSKFDKANHAPVIELNGTTGFEPFHIDAVAGSDVELDASKTFDPDGDELSFAWIPYKDITATQWWVDAEVATLNIKKIDEAGRRVKITMPPPEKCCVNLMSRQASRKGQVFHVILEVKDGGIPSMRAYRRIMIQATNEAMLGGGGSAADCIADVKHDLL